VDASTAPVLSKALVCARDQDATASPGGNVIEQMLLRRRVVVFVLGAWLAVVFSVGVAWGAGAALRAAVIVGFLGLIACALAVWARLAGDLDRRAGAWYYERQLNRRGNGGRRER
jgi:hypothetical protein